MADETEQAPEATPQEPVKEAPKARKSEPKLAPNQTLLQSGNIYTAN